MYWFPVPTKTFKTRYKNKSKSFQNKIDEALKYLSDDPDAKLICRRKHAGTLKDTYGYDLDEDNRIIIDFDEEMREMKLLRVCNHRHAYWGTR